MKHTILTLGLIAGMYMTAEAQFTPPPDTSNVEKKVGYKETVLESIFVGEKEKDSFDNEIGIPLLSKFDTINEINHAKIQDQVTYSVTVNSNRPFVIYQVTDPQNNKYRIISGPKAMFRGEVYKLEYLTLDKDKTLNFKEISTILYKGGSAITQEFENIDGIMINSKKLEK